MWHMLGGCIVAIRADCCCMHSGGVNAGAGDRGALIARLCPQRHGPQFSIPAPACRARAVQGTLMDYATRTWKWTRRVPVSNTTTSAPSSPPCVPLKLLLYYSGKTVLCASGDSDWCFPISSETAATSVGGCRWPSSTVTVCALLAQGYCDYGLEDCFVKSGERPTRAG